MTGENEQEIADKYADLKYAAYIGKDIPRKAHSFEKFAKENWRYITQSVSERTASNYHRYLTKNLLPYFGKKNLEDIDWRSIQAFYDKYSDKAGSTVHKWRVVLSRIMQIAVGDGLIANDPTKDKRLTHSKKKTARPVPSTERYKGVLKAVNLLSEHHERLYAALMVYTGLRKGEMLALRWTDVSLADNLIRVRNSIVLDGTSKKRPAVLKPPKTEAGNRDIPLVKPLKEILEAHQNEDEFVVTNQKTGKPVHVDAEFNTMWKNIKQQLDLGVFTSHSFRHAMCSTLLANGVDIKTTQSFIGHSQPSTTLNIYAHAIPSKIQEAGQIFGEKMAV